MIPSAATIGMYWRRDRGQSSSPTPTGNSMIIVPAGTEASHLAAPRLIAYRYDSDGVVPLDLAGLERVILDYSTSPSGATQYSVNPMTPVELGSFFSVGDINRKYIFTYWDGVSPTFLGTGSLTVNSASTIVDVSSNTEEGQETYCHDSSAPIFGTGLSDNRYVLVATIQSFEGLASVELEFSNVF